MRNIFIYGSQFFGEKYMIEIFTKKIFYNLTKYQNNWLNFSNYHYSSYFLHIISFLFYLLTVINFFFYFC